MKNIINTKTTIVLLTATTLFIASCQKKDTEAPVIAIESPTENDTMTVAGLIHMEFDVMDNEELHEISVSLKNAAGTVLFSDEKHADSKTLVYHEHHAPTGITAKTALTFTVVATDHNENKSTKTVNCFVKP
jgi:hypothetical protein